MSRISKFFDDDLKEQVFMVRGDEGYVRSTGIVVNVGSVNFDENTFTQEFNVSVYRDIGKSNVLFYANDELIKSVEWKDTTSKDTHIIVDGLYYDTDYIFRVVYTGNERCRRSSTKNIRIYQTKGEHPSTITLKTDKDSYFKNDPIKCDITLSSKDVTIGEQPVVVTWENKTVGTESIELTTDKNGKINHTFNGVKENGLWTCTVEFKGSPILSPAKTTKEISRGHLLIPSESKKIVIDNTTDTFEVLLTDYLQKTRYAKQTVWLISSRVGLKSAQTNTEGKAIFNDVAITQEHFQDKEIAYYYKKGDDEEYTADLTIDYVVPEILSVTKTPEIITEGDDVVINVAMKNQVEKIPITIYKNNVEIGKIYTNKDGIASTTYKAEGKGETVIKAECSNSQSKEITFWDYVQYWTPNHPPTQNQHYKTSTVRIDTLTDTFNMNLPNPRQGQDVYHLLVFNMFEEEVTPFTLKLSGVAIQQAGSSLGFGGATSNEFKEVPSTTIHDKAFKYGKDLKNEVITLKRDKDGNMSIQVGTESTKPLMENGIYPIFLVRFNGRLEKYVVSFNKLELWKD